MAKFYHLLASPHKINKNKNQPKAHYTGLDFDSDCSNMGFISSFLMYGQASWEGSESPGIHATNYTDL